MTPTLTPERKIALYLAIVFVVSWSIALTFLAIGGQWNTPGGQVVMLLFSTPPMFAALIVKGAIAKDPLLEQLALKFRLNRYWLLAWLLPLVVLGVTIIVAGLMPSVSWDLSVQAFLAQFPNDAENYAEFESQVWAFNREQGWHPTMRMVIEAMGAGITINALRGMGEELGWRGLMHWESKFAFSKRGVRQQTFLKRSLIIGAIWGVWYAPLVLGGFWYGEGGVLSVLMALVWCMAAAPVFSWIRERSGSVIPAAILYGTFSGLSQLKLPITGADPHLTGVHGLSGIIALVLVLVIIMALDKRSEEPLFYAPE